MPQRIAAAKPNSALPPKPKGCDRRNKKRGIDSERDEAMGNEVEIRVVGYQFHDNSRSCVRVDDLVIHETMSG